MSVPAWIAALPPAWTYRPLRHIAEVSNSTVDKKSYEGDQPVRLCNYTDVYYNEYITDEMAFMQATATAAEVGRFKLQPGDVLITKDSESWDDIAVPACVKEPLKDVVSGYHLTLLRPLQNRMFGPFMLRALQAQGIQEQFWLAANGVTRFGLGQLRMKDALLPLPPLDVQKAIADFLDRKTAAIDTLIEKKQRLLDLLAEKRHSLVHHTVTGGRDPEEAGKADADQEFVSEVLPGAPIFRRIRLDAVLKAVKRPLLVSPEETYQEIGVRSHGRGVFLKEPIRGSDLGQKSVYWVVPNSLVFNIVFAWEGAVATTSPEHEGLIASHRFPMYNVDTGLSDLRFMKHYFTAGHGRYLMREHSPGAAGRNRTLRQGDLLKEHAWLPYPDQQAMLAERVDQQVRRLERVASAVSAQVGRLQEYRQALITAAVTGQLDIATADGEEAA